MKVAVAPEQIVVVPAILTLTGKFGYTVIVNVLEVAVFETQVAILDVRTQVTASAFANVELE